MKQLSAGELKQMLQVNPGLALIDVREEYEHAAFNIGGTLIPLGEIMSRVEEIPVGVPVVLYCRKGIRSAIAIQRLQDKWPLSNLINLEGGMDAWRAMDEKNERDSIPNMAIKG